MPLTAALFHVESKLPMIHGIWSLLERSLRYDARSRWSHVLRLAALLSAYGAMWAASQSAPWLGAPGLRFFQNLVIMNALLIMAAGIGFFSSAITEEKEEGTLGLMLMTGLSPLAILLGKSGSRLTQAAYLVLLQIPFALLGVTLGGVKPQQVLAMYAALLALLFFVANAALLCSVLARNTRSASLWMVIATAGYCVGAWAAYEIARAIWGFAPPGVAVNSATSSLDRLAQLSEAAWGCSFFHRVSTIMQTGSRLSIISSHEIAHIMAGLACFLLSWATFGWATRQPDSEAIARGFLGFRLGRKWWFAPGRVWNAAIPWKEFHYLLGGWPVFVVKSLAYWCLWLFLWWYWHVLYNTTTYGYDRDQAVEVSIAFFSLLLALEAAVLASRVFSDEVRYQTWPVLVSLPDALGSLAYRKVAAAVGGLVPVLTGLFFLLFCTRTGWRSWADASDEPMFWGIVGMFTTIVHFSAWYSLYVRWGAVPLAAATVFGPFALFVMVIESMRLGRGPIDEKGIGVFICLVSIVTCAILHAAVGQRLRELAAR